jgi:hypothetical protein
MDDLGPVRSQDLAARAFDDVVPGVIAKPAQRHGAPDGLGLGRDQAVDPAPLKRAIDLGFSGSLLTRDPDLASLREDPEFVALVGSLKKARPEDAWPE